MTNSVAERTDEALLREIIAGDHELFGEIIDRYEAKITRYVKRFTQHEDDVVDLVQVIFIKAYTHLQSFDLNRSFNSWVYRIAHNESVNYLKKRGDSKLSFIDFDTFLPHPFANETADDKAFTRELKEVFESALAQISPKYREVLVLYYYEDLSYQEIADILQIPTATVGVRIKRAKEALQKHTTIQALQDK